MADVEATRLWAGCLNSSLAPFVGRLSTPLATEGRPRPVWRNRTQTLPIPNRCIWCHREPPDISFNISHVLPECAGNEYQQTLPPGIVCSDCTSYFGTTLEPVLLDDPFFHVIAVFLSLVDPDDMNVFRARVFDQTHQPDASPRRSLSLSAQTSESQLSLGVSYEIQGQISRQYTPRQLRFLSEQFIKSHLSRWLGLTSSKGLNILLISFRLRLILSGFGAERVSRSHSRALSCGVWASQSPRSGRHGCGGLTES